MGKYAQALGKSTCQLDIEINVIPILKSTKTYLDIGASRGSASIPFLDIFDKIIAFEPNIEACKELSKVVLEKAPIHKDKIEVKNIALSNYDGKLEVEFGWTNPNFYIEPYKDNAQCTIIDSFNFKDVDFIKIDVEGEEFNVLMGAINTIKKYRPIILYEDKKNTSQLVKKGITYEENHKNINDFFENIGYITQRTKRTWRPMSAKGNYPKGDMLAFSKNYL